MEGLIWLLALAALFFLMMRFGCGAHIMHGHGPGHDAEAGGKDPVCGMPRNPRSGYTKAHAGRNYWFCSKACLDKFDADPDRYVSGVAQGAGHEERH